MRKALMSSCALIALAGAALAQGTPANKDGTTQSPATMQKMKNTQETQKSGSSPSASSPMRTTETPGSEVGLQRVDAASLVMTFYSANPADTRASKLIGRTVYNLNNESIGEVTDLIIDNGKTIKAVVVGVGGFLGMGERNIAIAPTSIVISELKDGSARLVVNTTKEDLKKAAPFNFADVDKAGPGAGYTTGGGSGTSSSQK